MNHREEIFRGELHKEEVKRDHHAAKLYIATMLSDALREFIWHEFESGPEAAMVAEGCPQFARL